MRAWEGNGAVLAIERRPPGGEERVICLQEVSGHQQAIGEALVEALKDETAPGRGADQDQRSPAGWRAVGWRDLITGARFDAPGPLSLAPYQTLWLVAER